ncbi:Protein-disulfide isomerase [Tranquillimonas alkanivorans]|uniref:Protein-disulfide isomerase n=2 Tax=Tranquillimonas alkanivorans TaxID=441119 RepID=A0A1I5WC01_9RHOB|nr:Protein-disulfide isomerase [Tranquillimonas alkanivorans]
MKHTLVASALLCLSAQSVLAQQVPDTSAGTSPSVQAATETAQVDEANYMPQTGEDLADLLRGCTGTECLAYTSGVISGIAAFARLAEVDSPFCATGQLDAFDLSRIVDQSLESTPGLADYPAPYLLLTAFAQSYPCDASPEDFDEAALSPVDQEIVEALVEDDRTMVVYGDPEAPEARTIRVFHDPNCSHCATFRPELAELAAMGSWKIEIYPVSVVAEDSAGFAAVALALKTDYPELAMSLYRDTPAGRADMAYAVRRAEEAGIGQTELFGLVTRASGYEAVKRNTELFLKTGAKGTPSFIIGQTLHTGGLSAAAIQKLADSFEGEEDVALPDGGKGADPAPAEDEGETATETAPQRPDQ